MKCFGLIGYPLGHSFSQQYFSEKFRREGIPDCIYRNYPLPDLALLPSLLMKHPDLLGINVTIPYKEKVINYLDSVDEEAGRIGAVNTLKVTRTGNHIHLKGFNTDVYGFRLSVQPHLTYIPKRVLILGTGGASKAINYVMRELGFEILFVSRNKKAQNCINYEDLDAEIIRQHPLIINTSPVGMHPQENECPAIPYEGISTSHVLYDLIYNPAETRFLTEGKKRGAIIINGLQMLHLQAERSWEIWNS